MAFLPPLIPGQFFHIISRGINRETVFRSEENYRHFLQKYVFHVTPIADTFAYCLMSNHFHFLVRIKNEGEVKGEVTGITPRIASQAVGNCLNAYAKAFNRQYDRTGSLFERPFKRIPIQDESHLLTVIPYIHLNPQKHGFVADFRDWPWSSFGTLLTPAPTILSRKECLDYFGTQECFRALHLPEAVDWERYDLLV